jgi:hypothetical protein
MILKTQADYKNDINFLILLFAGWSNKTNNMKRSLINIQDVFIRKVLVEVIWLMPLEYR